MTYQLVAMRHVSIETQKLDRKMYIFRDLQTMKLLVT